MTNLCVRCEHQYPTETLTTIVNDYHNGPPWIYVCDSCLKVGDRIAGPLEIEWDEDDEWGPDSEQQALERGPR